MYLAIDITIDKWSHMRLCLSAMGMSQENLGMHFCSQGMSSRTVSF